MVVRSYLAVLLSLSLCGITAISAHAQEDYERDVVYEAGRNKVGLLRYCRDNALLDRASADSAASAVEAGIAGFAPDNPAGEERGEKAEKAGEAGFWEANGKRDLASLAKLFGTTRAGLCQEWAAETLRNQQMENARQAVPVDVPDALDPSKQSAVTAASRIRPPVRAKQPSSLKAAARAQDVVRKAPYLPKPVLPERGPRAENAARQATVVSPPPPPPPAEENRWDSSKVAIPVPFFRIIRPSEQEKPAAAKAPAPDAAADPALRRDAERSPQRPRPWQIPSRCTLEGGPPQLSTRCRPI